MNRVRFRGGVADFLDNLVVLGTNEQSSLAERVRFDKMLASMGSSLRRALEEIAGGERSGPLTKAAAAQLANYAEIMEGNVIFREKDRLRAYTDIGLSVRAIEAVFSDEVRRIRPSPDKPWAVFADLQPSCRSLVYLAGVEALDDGDLDTAKRRVDQLLTINAVDPDGQDLLYEVLTAMKARGDNPDTSDISLADLSDRFCQRPFTTLVTGVFGESFLCDCPAYLPFAAGNVLYHPSADAIWNSDAAQELRRSILDGDFSYCSRTLCGLLKDGALPKRDEVSDPFLRDVIDNRRVVLETGPQTVQLSHDASCNLACPSCRTEIITLKASEQGIYDRSRDNVVLPLLASTKGTVMVSGGGDPFASKHYRSVLAGLDANIYPDLRVCILTNALLLNEKQWNEFKSAHPLISTLLVSVDAARPETYEVVRRPGRFERLLPNLEFLAARRRAGDIGLFGLCFVVQQLNFREMPEFVELGRRLGCDVIWFQRIVNFGSYTSQEILDADVARPGHPDHDSFAEVLRHPLMSDPSVRLFSAFLQDTAMAPEVYAEQAAARKQVEDRQRWLTVALATVKDRLPSYAGDATDALGDVIETLWPSLVHGVDQLPDGAMLAAALAGIASSAPPGAVDSLSRISAFGTHARAASLAAESVAALTGSAEAARAALDATVHSMPEQPITWFARAAWRFAVGDIRGAERDARAGRRRLTTDPATAARFETALARLADRLASDTGEAGLSDLETRAEPMFQSLLYGLAQGGDTLAGALGGVAALASPDLTLARDETRGDPGFNPDVRAELLLAFLEGAAPARPEAWTAALGAALARYPSFEAAAIALSLIAPGDAAARRLAEDLAPNSRLLAAA